jgi:hypothetical protein
MPVPKEYLGHLSSHDPLHHFLVHDVLPQIGVRNNRAEFRVFSMKDSKVYLYEERYSCAQVVGKYFVSGGHHAANAIQRMRQEFDNLTLPAQLRAGRLPASHRSSAGHECLAQQYSGRRIYQW